MVEEVICGDAQKLEIEPELNLAVLETQIRAIATEAGLVGCGFASVEPFDSTLAEIERRKALNLHDGMAFTFKNPPRSTNPAAALPNAATLIVAAMSYAAVAPSPPADKATGRIARYSWVDNYAPLRVGLGRIASKLKHHGFRARVLADDNTIVDRAAATRAGVGWIGKNSNLLIPEFGSWFVLGCVVTDAAFILNQLEVADGCGSCNRCIEACPTEAIPEAGVVDARKCLAWIVQKPGVMDARFYEAVGDRIYGCDDCQDVCPINKVFERRVSPAKAAPVAQPFADLVELASATDGEILAKYGRFYMPERDPSGLRRNALVALGNVGDPTDETLVAVVDGARSHRDRGVAEAAEWSLARLLERETTPAAVVCARS